MSVDVRARVTHAHVLAVFSLGQHLSSRWESRGLESQQGLTYRGLPEAKRELEFFLLPREQTYFLLHCTFSQNWQEIQASSHSAMGFIPDVSQVLILTSTVLLTFTQLFVYWTNKFFEPILTRLISVLSLGFCPHSLSTYYVHRALQVIPHLILPTTSVFASSGDLHKMM